MPFFSPGASPRSLAPESERAQMSAEQPCLHLRSRSVFRRSLEVLPELRVSEQSTPSGAGVSLTRNYNLSPSARNGFPIRSCSQKTPQGVTAPLAAATPSGWQAGGRRMLAAFPACCQLVLCSVALKRVNLFGCKKRGFLLGTQV